MNIDTDQPRIQLRSASQTDVGLVREHNEDSATVDELADFYVVADGMGGHAAGEVASAMAVETIKEELSRVRETVLAFANAPSERGRKKIFTLLEAAVIKAHNEVYERGIREPDKQGMGTTLDVVLLAGPEAFVAHVGDSRTYLIREGKASQVTTDHTVAEVLVLEGKLSVEEAQLSPLRTILVNAIGVAPEVGVEMNYVRLRTNDQLLLCSDGLHDYFPSENELAKHILAANEPKNALDKLVELAKDRGGQDNITGIIIEVLNAPEETMLSAFEIDLTQPSAKSSPPVSGGGDTIPHLAKHTDSGSSGSEESEATEKIPTRGNSDSKKTLPLRPIVDLGSAQTEPADNQSENRESIGRAQTLPPEDTDSEPVTERLKTSAAQDPWDEPTEEIDATDLKDDSPRDKEKKPDNDDSDKKKSNDSSNDKKKSNGSSNDKKKNSGKKKKPTKKKKSKSKK